MRRLLCLLILLNDIVILIIPYQLPLRTIPYDIFIIHSRAVIPYHNCTSLHSLLSAHSLLMTEAGDRRRRRGRDDAEVDSDSVVLTSPLSVDEEDGRRESEETTNSSTSVSNNKSYRAPNILHRILSLLSNVRPGSDLTRLQLPPLFNIPKSQLQVYGETVYCDNNDLLSRCANGGSSLDRFTAVIAWSISTVRPLMFGVAPYNPILGETHHVSRGNLNVLLEQVSHHPPVSALHATDEKENIETIWCHHAVPKFHGTSVEVEVRGRKQLNLLNKGETYVLNSPKLVIRFFPVPGVEWLGDVRIRCQETGLEAELCYKGNAFLGRRSNHRSIKGKIFMSSSMKTICEITGHWDKTVIAKDTANGKLTVIYNAKEAISGLKTPTVKNPKELWATESAVVWGEVSQGILTKSWEEAREAKTRIEQEEREKASKEQTWTPKHFTASYTKESGWECLPNQRWVPPAPIVVPSP